MSCRTIRPRIQRTPYAVRSLPPRVRRSRCTGPKARGYGAMRRARTGRRSAHAGCGRWHGDGRLRRTRGSCSEKAAEVVPCRGGPAQYLRLTDPVVHPLHIVSGALGFRCTRADGQPLGSAPSHPKADQSRAGEDARPIDRGDSSRAELPDRSTSARLRCGHAPPSALATSNDRGWPRRLRIEARGAGRL